MRELQPKLFKRAVEIAGDAQKLCIRLHIVEDDLARAAQDRRQQPRHQKPPEENGPADAVTAPR